MHAANRGENIVVVFVNNAIYGMTGGGWPRPRSWAGRLPPRPTAAAWTSTDTRSRSPTLTAILDGTCYVTRQSVHTPANVRKTKAALKKAFENALAKKGTSVVEVVATCNSGWKMVPEKSNEWMAEHMFAKYPLGDLKNE